MIRRVLLMVLVSWVFLAPGSIPAADSFLTAEDLPKLQAPSGKGMIVIYRPIDPMMCVPEVFVGKRKIYEARDGHIYLLRADDNLPELTVHEERFWANANRRFKTNTPVEVGKVKFYIHDVDAGGGSIPLCRSDFMEVDLKKFTNKMKNRKIPLETFDLFDTGYMGFMAKPFDPLLVEAVASSAGQEQFASTPEVDDSARQPADIHPPVLLITSPPMSAEDRPVVQQAHLLVAGKVSDDSGVAFVTVNGQQAALDDGGNFSAEVLLRVGDNSITVTALDIHRNQSTEKFTVTREGMKAQLAESNPPTIVITTPQITRGMNLIARETVSRVSGMVKDDSGVASVTVNGQQAMLDDQGHFSAEILLKMGENSIVVSALDIYRNQATEQFRIIREGAPIARTEDHAPLQVASGRDLALVIGINEYRHLERLQSAVADARKISSVLREDYGFETRVLLNEEATRAGIIRELNALRRQLTSEDRLLIYYAGHGDYNQQTDTAYWLPVDAERDETTYWIAAKTISDELKRISARHILVVADSCFSGTLSRRASTELFANETREKFLRKQQEKPSRVLLASGGNEPVSDSGGEGHSIFARAFIAALQNPAQKIFTAEELHINHLKESVAGQSDQTPEYKVIRNSGHDGGDFVFFKRN